MRIYYLSEQVPAWGRYTGYTRLPHYVRQIDPDTRHLQIGRSRRWLNWLGRLANNNLNRPRSQSYRTLYEWYFYAHYTHRMRPPSIVHLLNFHATYPILDRFGERAPKQLTATVHHPQVSLMTGEQSAYLSRLSSAIVLYRRDVQRLETDVGKGRVKFVHHGVDVDFFRPAATEGLPQTPRLLFIGRVLRNTAMLARLIRTMATRFPEVGFDLVVSSEQRQTDPHLKTLTSSPTVRWHSQVSSQRLRTLYQQSYLLVMPLVDSGANNALVEALACGLPAVTNGVGGVRDYGGDTVFPTAGEDDDEAMLDLIGRYLADFGWRNEVAAAAREFAVSRLAWPVVARKHREIYEELCL